MGLYLVTLKIVLLFKFLPNFNLVNEVGKDIARALQLEQLIFFFVNFLQVLLLGIHEETIGIYVLWQADARKEHVDELVYSASIKVSF